MIADSQPPRKHSLAEFLAQSSEVRLLAHSVSRWLAPRNGHATQPREEVTHATQQGDFHRD